MENAIDAIKIAFSIFIFVIALALTVSVIGQARTASEVIFHANDKTEFYEYVTEDTVAKTEDRIVGIETVIPTIHRYSKEQFAVTIFDNKGIPIVRYDLWTEGFMSNWNKILKDYNNGDPDAITNYNDVKDRLQRVQDIVNKTVNKNINFDMDNLGNLYKVTSTSNSNITVGAPWIGEDSEILERIKCDMTGKTYTKNMISYKGKNLKSYKNNTFIEKFLEISTSGATITDDEYSLETIKGNKKLEIIYIMQ